MSTTEDTRRLSNSTKKSSAARKKADALWEEHKNLIRDIYRNGELSLQDIARVTNVTKARVWQIVKDYKPNNA